ncbi:hypothetical protein [Sinorhizobium medicae]|uniref:hypothetical protein n=1 Tax=Sinorhizobium medicae TaxID=110321 RepID=UPI000FD90C3B|nr:hypothetical protein [Sinorhizobium medicae]RVJ68829.1 hypothetical protein CN168_31980 [Sinorhizobium medicae]
MNTEIIKKYYRFGNAPRATAIMNSYVGQLCGSRTGVCVKVNGDLQMNAAERYPKNLPDGGNLPFNAQSAESERPFAPSAAELKIK